MTRLFKSAAGMGQPSSRYARLGLAHTGHLQKRRYTNPRALNTYTGNTTILEGTLQISQAFLADTSTVSLSGAGLLDLSFVGTDTVAALFLDGAPQPNGTYNSLTPGGAGAFFSGTGSLVVVPEPTACAMAVAGLARGGFWMWRRRKQARTGLALRANVSLLLSFFGILWHERKRPGVE